MGTRCADHVTPLYPQKLALTSPTGGGRSVGIVRSRIKATEFSFSLLLLLLLLLLTSRSNFTSLPRDLCVPQSFRTRLDNIWLRSQIIKLVIMKFSTACFYFHSLHSKE